jgi:hypothetical protein
MLVQVVAEYNTEQVNWIGLGETVCIHGFALWLETPT